MQKKISAFTFVGLALALFSLLVSGKYIFTVIFVIIPAILFCIIGRRKGGKGNKVLATIGIVFSIIMFFYVIYAPWFIKTVNHAKEQTRIEQEQ